MFKRDLFEKISTKGNCVTRLLNHNLIVYVCYQEKILEDHLKELKSIKQKLKDLKN